MTEATCEQCKLQPESVLQALWSCPCLNEVWDSDHVWSFRSTQTLSDFEQLVLHIIDAGLDLDVFSMVAWSLWYRRNQVRVGNSVPSIGQTLVQVQQQLQDYYRAQLVKSTSSNHTYHSATRWTPPPAPTLKINYDGAVFRDSNEAGIGAVIRDNQGRVIESLAKLIALPQIVAAVEAAAASQYFWRRT